MKTSNNMKKILKMKNITKTLTALVLISSASATIATDSVDRTWELATNKQASIRVSSSGDATMLLEVQKNSNADCGYCGGEISIPVLPKVPNISGDAEVVRDGWNRDGNYTVFSGNQVKLAVSGIPSTILIEEDFLCECMPPPNPDVPTEFTMFKLSVGQGSFGGIRVDDAESCTFYNVQIGKDEITGTIIMPKGEMCSLTISGDFKNTRMSVGLFNKDK